MTFLNPLILLGVLGIGLPILAHLINRQQIRRTDWAAMQFLNRSVRVRSRQIRLRDILLLLLRCLALLLLVFALARPASNNEDRGRVLGEQRAGVIIAVDGSFSMEGSFNSVAIAGIYHFKKDSRMVLKQYHNGRDENLSSSSTL